MTAFPIDLVVTYVDGSEQKWLNSVSQYKVELSAARFRTWDIFQFWFRCVETNLPFIRTIHLVVSNIEQVPKWLDTNKVHIVLHEEILPSCLLPTFNSTTIEMFLHRIPGLAEHFIYSNDDVFPFKPIDVHSFFNYDWLPIYEITRIYNAKRLNTFTYQCKNSYALAYELLKTSNCENAALYWIIQHGINPMLKSIYEEVHQKAKDRIIKSCTKFREIWNFTQYLFPDYAFMTGHAVEGKIDMTYVRLDNDCISLNDIDSAVICLNDHCPDKIFDVCKQAISQQFALRFPNKSRFEI